MTPAPQRLEIRKGDAIDVAFACGAQRLRFRVCRRDVGADGGHTVALEGPLADAESDAPPEILRFDLFRDDPHYHVPSSDPKQIDIDAARDGEALAFALAAIRTKLPDLIERAGRPELASALDASGLPALAERVRAAVAAAPEPTSSTWIELPPPPAERAR